MGKIKVNKFEIAKNDTVLYGERHMLHVTLIGEMEDLRDLICGLMLGWEVQPVKEGEPSPYTTHYPAEAAPVEPPKAEPPAAEATPTVAPEGGKKRGRPKGSKNHPKTDGSPSDEHEEEDGPATAEEIGKAFTKTVEEMASEGKPAEFIVSIDTTKIDAAVAEAVKDAVITLPKAEPVTAPSTETPVAGPAPSGNQEPDPWKTTAAPAVVIKPQDLATGPITFTSGDLSDEAKADGDHDPLVDKVKDVEKLAQVIMALQGSGMTMAAAREWCLKHQPEVRSLREYTADKLAERLDKVLKMFFLPGA